MVMSELEKLVLYTSSGIAMGMFISALVRRLCTAIIERRERKH